MTLTVTPGKASATRLGLVKVSTGLSIDANGNLSASLSPSDIPSLAASKITSGQLATARGGTGLDSSGVTDGQLLIGRTSDNTFGLAALTAGSGVSITNAGHGITIAATGSGGTVTSAALSAPAEFNVSGSPITGSGTLALAWATETANTILSGPTTGSAAAPTFRALVAADIPNLPASQITSGTLALARGGTNTDGSSVTANTVFSGPTSGGAASAAFRALVAGDIPSLAASKITSGTLALAQGGTNADNSSVTANTVWSGPSSGGAASAAYRALVAADIPSLAASKITSGTFGDAYIASGITASKISGALSAATIAGSAITGAASLSDSILSANVPLLNAANTFTALQTATAFAPSGLTGSTATTRYVGGTASVAPTSGAHNVGDWVITQAGSIYICTTAGTPGTWTAVSGGGGGFTSPLTTKGDVHAYSTTDARLGVGADGTFLAADSSQATGLAYKFPAGIAGVSTLSNALSANVTMTSANTYYDGPSLSLTAGTWLLISSVSVKCTSATVTGKLWDGTTVYDSTTATNANNYKVDLALTAIVSPTSTTTYKVSVAGDSASNVILAAADVNGAGNNASTLVAVQLTGAPASGPGALMPAVRCYNSANQSISNATSTALTFDTNQFDQGTSVAQHSTSSNTSRLTCRQAGVYQISGTVGWASGATGIRDLWISLNGTTTIGESDIQVVSGGAMSVTAMHYLNVGDYIELYVYQNNGGAINSLTLGGDIPNFGMARIDSGPGAVQPNTKVQLDYEPSADIISALSLTSNTWIDLISNQTFTVDDANSVVEIETNGFVRVLVGSGSNAVAVRLNVDSGGTPITKALGGEEISVGNYKNILNGTSPVSLTGLSAGSHTVKLQAYSVGATATAYCRPSSQSPYETFSLRVLERKQSSGPALIPNTKVQLQDIPGSDVQNGTALSATTWTDFRTNQTFTVDDANSVVEIAVSVGMTMTGAAGAAIAVRMVVDSAGTPITRYLAGNTTAGTGGQAGNPFAGAGTQAFTGLSAGSHTVKVQVYASSSQTVYCRPGTQTNYESYSLTVLERKQAPTPTLNTTARYHQASGTAQSISNNTVTILNYDTLDLDTQSLVTTGASWKCTAKTVGNYQVSAAAALASAIWAGTGKVQLFLYKNGALYSQLAYNTIQVANTDAFGVQGSDTLALNVGDYVDVRISQNQGGAVALVGDLTQNYVCINRVS